MSWRPNPLLGYWKKMCDEPTAAEAALEPAIAALGERYRHQYPFWNLKYFADFALLDRKLIIEVDGDSHNKPAQKEKDLIHELQVLEQGWITMRITNQQALTNPQDALERGIQAVEKAERSSLDKDFRAQQLTDALAQLHQDYPDLLAAAATKAKRRRQSAIAGAQARARARSKRSSRAQA